MKQKRKNKEGVSDSMKIRYFSTIHEIYTITKNGTVEISSKQQSIISKGVASCVWSLLVDLGYLNRVGNGLYVWASSTPPNIDTATSVILKNRENNRRQYEKRKLAKNELDSKNDLESPVSHIPDGLSATDMDDASSIDHNIPAEVIDINIKDNIDHVKKPKTLIMKDFTKIQTPYHDINPLGTLSNKVKDQVVLQKTTGSIKSEEKKTILWGFYSYSRKTYNN